ncbi:Warthog protein [Trichinella spiralis]|uniref:Warthog protein n=1 Tax=Trichinella spiralis TaxID=6334 RepID=A0ABR3KL24_TRISP
MQAIQWEKRTNWRQMIISSKSISGRCQGQEDVKKGCREQVLCGEISKPPHTACSSSWLDEIDCPILGIGFPANWNRSKKTRPDKKMHKLLLELGLTLMLIATVANGAAMCPGDAGERTFIQPREKCTCTCDNLIASNVQTEAIAEPAVEMVENGGRARCFHGDDWVLTTNGRMQMKHLLQKKDAQVLTRSENGHLEYSPVMTWIHAQKETKAQFINLETESGHRLSLTPLHMIYQTNCDGKEMVLMAEKVAVGKCIFVKADNDKLVESKVVSTSKVVKTGIYSPITTSGSIVVNDVLASCFSTSANEDIQRLLFKYASFVYSLFTCPASLISDSFSHQQQDYVEIPKLLLGALNLQKYLIQ